MNRALAFRHSICALKCLPVKLTSVKQIKNLKYIGEHSLKVIEDILNYGESEEINSIKANEHYQVVKQFNSIYCCGSNLSSRFYELGLRSVQSIREASHLKNDRIKYGLAYFDDLNTPVTLSECKLIYDTIRSIILDVDHESLVDLVGGFSRHEKDVNFFLI